MRPKNKTFTSFSNALKNTISKLGIKKRFTQYMVIDSWDKIAGGTIASHARPARWSKDVLIINVEHATWMQELSFLKPVLLQKIKESIPEIVISDIRFEIAKNRVTMKPESRQ